MTKSGFSRDNRSRCRFHERQTQYKTAIKSFLGLVRYYARFVPNLSELAMPLQNLLKKNSDPKTHWGDEKDDAVKAIKEAFISPAILKHYKPSLRTILQTDASDYAMGAVLSESLSEEGEIVLSLEIQRSDYEILIRSNAVKSN